MSIVLKNIDGLTSNAVKHYWETLSRQASKQKKGTDHGRRSAVTGGKQMDGFAELVEKVLISNGLPKESIFLNKKMELPGYFRPTKNWDMLVVDDGVLLAAIEFKSQRGPSFGNNFNNRTEEAIGTSKDLWTAYRDNAFGEDSIKPWVGWLMMVEESPRSTSPVKVSEPHFEVFPEFKEASYLDRYELLLRKLVKEQLYSQGAFLTSTEEGGLRGRYSQPADDLSLKYFLADLAGHISAYLATK